MCFSCLRIGISLQHAVCCFISNLKELGKIVWQKMKFCWSSRQKCRNSLHRKLSPLSMPINRKSLQSCMKGYQCKRNVWQHWPVLSTCHGNISIYLEEFKKKKGKKTEILLLITSIYIFATDENGQVQTPYISSKKEAWNAFIQPESMNNLIYEVANKLYSSPFFLM